MEKSQEKYALEKTSSTKITVTVRVPWTELEPTLPKAAEAISADMEIEGFRKGRAPHDIVKQTIGEFKILEEAARMNISANFEKLLKEIKETEYKEQSFEPIGEPHIAITKLASGEKLEYKITLFLLPTLELPDYKAIAKKIASGRKTPEIAEKEIESAVSWLRESRAKVITVNRPAQKGDRVEIDFSTLHGGVPLEGGESKNHPVTIGENKLMPGFEENLVGMSAGEEKTFSLTAPADYHEKSIAGKTLEFAVKMKSAGERTMPEWDDAFARSLGNFSSVSDVIENIRTGLLAEKEERERERVRMEIVDVIAKDTRADIPEPLIARELEKMTGELEHSIERMGLKFSEYLDHIKKTPESLRQEWQPDAERRVKIALVLREIARRENIQPSGSDIDEAAKRTAAHQGLTEEDLQALDHDAFREYNRGIARNEKVFQLLESISS